MLTIIMGLWKMYWKQLVVALLVGAVCWFGYSKIHDAGVAEGKAQEDAYWKPLMQNEVTAINKKISDIEAASHTQASNAQANTFSTEKKLDALLQVARTSKKEMIYVNTKTNKCEFSSDFIQAYRNIGEMTK